MQYMYSTVALLGCVNIRTDFCRILAPLDALTISVLSWCSQHLKLEQAQ